MMSQLARVGKTKTPPLVIETESVSAPVGGWNARDALANMPREDAVILDNWFPDATDVMLRKGRENHVTGGADQFETLMAYASPTVDTLFGIAGTSIYDVTAPGALGAAVVTGLTNARWQFINYRTSGGSFLQLVNGADAPRLWDGATWEAQTGVSAHPITGVTATDLIHITQHKRRVWFVQKDSLRAWYLPVDSVGGAANSLDLGGVFKMGGYLMAAATWTLDAGEGLDDHLVFITSKGQVAVYAGTDPSASATWHLVGVYNVGAPLGRRCLLKAAGDLILICKDGFQPLTSALQSTRVRTTASLSDKIRKAVSAAALAYGANFGWQCLLYPLGSMLIFNVPIAEGAGQHQYVMNTDTKTWCRFRAWDANCWELFLDEPYFGGDGYVSKAWTGTDDAGDFIRGDVKTAFNYFGTRGQNKQWTLARPMFISDPPVGADSIVFTLNVDFDDTLPTTTPTYSGTLGAAWDTALWDGSTWVGEAIMKDWQTVLGIGFCAALRMLVAVKNTTLRWTATDYIMQVGGPV